MRTEIKIGLKICDPKIDVIHALITCKLMPFIPSGYAFFGYF
jgi:hypothetical protein